MRKKDILKMHGLTEEQFYKLYPTEEAYRMAMGGTPFAQFMQKGGGAEAALKANKKPFVEPAGASKVAKPSEGYTLMEGQDPNALKLYYDKQIESAKPGSLPQSDADKAKYEKFLIAQVQSGVHPKKLEEKGYIAPGTADKYMKDYKAQYVEKEKPAEKPKMLDLGIGWGGKREEVFGHSMPKFRDPSGKEYNMQQFKVPAQWNEKTKTWDTESGWNQPTVLSGYVDASGKFNPFDTSASKISYQGETPYYSQEGIKYPSYVQSGEAAKVMKSGPQVITGATAMDVQNTGMNYNPNKDVTAPLNTMGTARGVGQEQLIQNVGVGNLPAGTGMINYQQFGGQPDFYNPPYLLMAEGGYIPELPEWMKMGGCMECGGMHKQMGGTMSADMEGQYPVFNYGGPGYQYGGDPSLPAISPKESLKMFKNLAKGGQPTYPGQNQQSKTDEIRNDFMNYIRNSTMDAIAREEHSKMMSEMFQFGGNNPYGYNPNMNNQQAFKNAWQQGQQNFNTDMANFGNALTNMYKAQQGYSVPPNNLLMEGQPTIQTTGYVQPFDYNFAGAPKPHFTTPESVGLYPGQQPKQKPQYQTRSMEPEANAILAGMSGLASIFELRDAKKNEEKWRSMQGADNQFYSMPGGNRGDYDQFGNFRPNQKVPVQFAGQNFGQQGSPYTFQEGGEYFMTDDQINSIIESGGEIEFLD